MGNRLYLALGLALAPLYAAQAADPEASGIYTAADALLADAAGSVRRLQECKKLARFLRADSDRKQAELRTEFNGRIPPAFGNLLNIKQKRANKQETLCMAEELVPAELFRRAHDTLRGIEPNSLPGIAVRQKKLAQARLIYNQLITPAKKSASVQ